MRENTLKGNAGEGSLKGNKVTEENPYIGEQHVGDTQHRGDIPHPTQAASVPFGEEVNEASSRR